MEEQSFEQRPYGNTAFAENPENRCPVVLLLDTSLSMRGTPIDELNAGLQVFKDALASDTLASKRVEIAIVSFGPVSIETDFVEARHFAPPHLTAANDTPLGAAIERGLELLRERKRIYTANGVQYYRSWVFLITDGAPTDSIANAKTLIAEGERTKSLLFYAVGVEGANIDALRSLSVRDPVKLKGLNFAELFKWLSSSLSAMSRSTPGDEVPLTNPTAPNGWATTA